MSITKTQTTGTEKSSIGRADPENLQLPITILTGFLGSGKTTCLNAFLQSSAASDTAVLINEFGEIDIDGAVLSANLADGSKLMTLPNGCVCCAVQEDLAEALLELAERAQSSGSTIRRCIVETTGLADPGAIIRGVGHDPRLKKATRVALTVTVCAADRLHDQLHRFEEVGRQIGIADRILISKLDLVTASEHESVAKSISAINPLAEMQNSGSGHFDAVQAFGPIKDNPERTLDQPAHGHHHHSASVQTFTIRLDRPLDPGLFRDVMSFMIMRHAENILRIKGLAWFSGETSPRLLNGVHDVFSSEASAAAPQGPGTSGSIVFIGIDLPEEEMRADLQRCIVSRDEAADEF